MSGNQRRQQTGARPKQGNVFSRIEGHFQGKTLAGFLEVVPILTTIIVLLFLFGHADNLIRPMPYVSGQPWDFPGIGIIVLVVAFYLIGLLISSHFGRRLLSGLSAILLYVPLVKVIFGVTQQATAALGSQYNFSRVVFLEWPRDGMVAMGFVTGRVYSHERTESMVSVYIPTVPNPTSGNLAFVLEDDVVETDMTVEDAMKVIFSGGIVLPEVITLARVPREPGVNRTNLVGRFETERS